MKLNELFNNVPCNGVERSGDMIHARYRRAICISVWKVW